MAIVTEPRWTGEHVVSESNGQRSREQGTLAKSGNLAAGTVLALNANGDYVPLDPTANDGADPAQPTPPAIAVAVLYAPTDASAEAAPCVVHTRDCEVHGERLGWPEGITDEQLGIAAEQLASVGIVVR